ncbi:putative TIR domain, P-loop containing nucleoside triphosphate hydrolase [Arabidopsis thaliana]
MASSSSSSSSLRNWAYHVFTSFHGEDVRKTFLSHLRKQFNCNGITMFDDQGIKRGQSIAPELTQGIRDSRISIILLSKNYASSSWCLDELLEILKCKEDIGQIVITVFYGVDTSDVRKQTGVFGIAFNKTCAGKTEEERTRWSKALTDAANIAGVDFKNCNSEAEMIEKIANDVSNQLNATPSRDFDGMVGLEAHLREMESLLDLDYVGVQMVGISGPAGIGKSTIARALHSRLSNRFQFTCFEDNLWESFPIGFDEVLIILDDVNHIKQLEALANETTWFGPGSRIIVTTENNELLRQHGINNTYHVVFPSDEKALKILCRYAFRQSYPHNGFKKLALRVTKLCGNLPLGLRVVGSSLRGKNEEEWEEVIHRLDNILDHQDIEEVLRVGYKSLHENEQSIFLHIVVFFNYKDSNLVKAMFAGNNLDIKHGLKILLNRSLIYISNDGEIVMHKLLQQMGRKVVQREEPWKLRILVNAQEICDVLERAKGNREVSGISFDTSGINEVFIKKGALQKLHNLQFLRVYKSKINDGNDVVYIPKEMEFPSFLKLLDWEAYPSKSLPAKFNPNDLVELNLQNSKLKRLWEGPQHLPNLKKMNLRWSYDLKQLPDLSNATNLESLDLHRCESLVEVPSCIGNLHKVEQLDMGFCINLQVVPTLFNLASLDYVVLEGCSQLKNFLDISTNIRALAIADTMLEELPKLIRLWYRLRFLSIYGSVRDPHVGRADIEKIPDWIKDLHGLISLQIFGCPKLRSLPELPGSLETLIANTCESLETLVSFPTDSQLVELYFPNCFKLGQEARKVITQQSSTACLPGRTIPAEFHHRAIGNSLTFRPGSFGFRICVVVSPKPEMEEHITHYSMSRICINGVPTDQLILTGLCEIQGEHLCITQIDLSDEDRWLEPEKEILLEIITTHQEVDIIECGVQILTDETYITIRSYDSRPEQASEDDDEISLMEQ